MYHDLAGAISYRLYFHESSPLEIVLADMCQPLSGERGLPHSGVGCRRIPAEADNAAEVLF